MNVMHSFGVLPPMKTVLVTVLIICSLRTSAQVGTPGAGLPIARNLSLAQVLRDSIGPADIVIGVSVDSLCRFGAKRVVSEFPGGCANMAMKIIGPKTELELMKHNRFKCAAGEIRLVVACQADD
jgi:hypothetical protein